MARSQFGAWTPAIIVEVSGFQRRLESCAYCPSRRQCDYSPSPLERITRNWADDSFAEIAEFFPIIRTMKRRIALRITDRVDVSGIADILIICGHPAYEHLRQTIRTGRAAEDCDRESRSLPQVLVECESVALQPSNDRLACLIESRIRIIGTLVINSPTMVLPSGSAETAPGCQCPFHRGSEEEVYSLSPFHIFSRKDWPVKNVGELKFATLPEAFPLPEIVFRHLPGLELPVVAVDGIVGAGKTTRMKGMEKAAIGCHFEYEDTEAIYATIRRCREAGIVGKKRREAIEECVFRSEEDFLLALPTLASKAYIERNWIYSRWVFGEYPDPFPRVDERLAFYFTHSRARFVGSIVLWTDPETAIQWVRSRGTQDEIDVDFERELERRLRILFDSPYEWAYGKVLDADAQ